MKILLALIFAWFAVRFEIGNMFGELTQPNQEILTAVDLAPSDPLSNWLLKSLTKDKLWLSNTKRSSNFRQMIIVGGLNSHVRVKKQTIYREVKMLSKL